MLGDSDSSNMQARYLIVVVSIEVDLGWLYLLGNL